MSMTIEHRDCNNETILKSEVDDDDRLSFLFEDLSGAEFPFLGYIEPFFDTYFNSAQMAGLMPEVYRLMEQNQKNLDVLNRLLQLAIECSKIDGSLLVFIGD